MDAVKSDEPWFLKWREILRIRSQPLDELTVQELHSPDGRLGWTLANVLRRFPLTQEQLLQIRTIFRCFESAADDRRAATVRWRCVHVLGESREPSDRELLLGALEDVDKWVAYGAIRALIEVASRMEREERAVLLDAIKERLDRLHPRVLDELGSAVFLEDLPFGWGDDVTPVLETVRDTRTSPGAKELWDSLLSEFREYADGG